MSKLSGEYAIATQRLSFMKNAEGYISNPVFVYVAQAFPFPASESGTQPL